MDFTNIKDMSIGNLKITSIYYNGNILYQEQSKRELTLFKFGEVINNSRVLPLVKTYAEGNFKTIKMGNTIDNSRVIPLKKSYIEDSMSLLRLER